jgi:putative ABC transport system permease protein
MNLLSLALKSLRNRWFSAFLCVLTIGLSTALLLAVEHIRAGARSSFQSTVSGTDLIVGARTGAVPLLLYTVFHVGEASNNVSWASYQRYANLSSVRWTIPISLGDSYQGFRVVGTTDAMFKHYRFGAKRALEFSQGQAFNNTEAQAVVGSAVAEKLGLNLGAVLAVSHGLGNVGFIKHEHAQQTLVGVLAATGTPIDQSVFVNLAAIESMHEGFDGSARLVAAKADLDHDHADHADHTDHDVEIAHIAKVPSTPKAITAFFVGLKVRPMALALQRQINEDTSEPLLAIMPTATLQQLWRLVGVAEQALSLVSIAVVVTGLLGMMMALIATLEQRRREMAILRSVGARGHQIFSLLLLESSALTLAGLAFGAVLISILLVLFANALASRYGLFLSVNWLSARTLLGLALIFMISLLLAVLPAVAAYRRALADGLSVKL